MPWLKEGCTICSCGMVRAASRIISTMFCRISPAKPLPRLSTSSQPTIPILCGRPIISIFRDHILPELKQRVRNKDLRIWSAGCSTGEEPYTLAFFIDEFFGKEKALWDTKILATDISTRVLDYAVKGVYSVDSVKNLPNHWLRNYFRKHESGYEIVDRIKREVIFRKFNLMDRIFPFKKKFHIIFCRNVMIYFDKQTKAELIRRFYDAMEYGAYLFIGHSESINRGESPFKYVMPSVYRKE